MSLLLDLAISTTRGWTGAYTRGLPQDVRAERREEIDCDLWEQRRLAELGRESALGTATHVLFRLILGMPEDLLWRIEVPSLLIERSSSVNDKWFMRVGLVLVSLPILFLIVNGIGIAFFGAGDFNNSTEHVLWGLAFLVCPVVTLVGLILCRTQPKLGLSLVVVGAVTSALMMFWMAFITVPAAIVVILFAIRRSGLSIWPFRTGTGPTAAA
jgi:hypothetical protein